VDALNGTWVRCLFGSKLWWIVPQSVLDDNDWERLASKGKDWDPGDKARAIRLGPVDLLLLPPGEKIIHAVLTPEVCLMNGGMIWDDLRLPEILRNIYWIGSHQSATNEALPFQLSAVLDLLEQRFKKDEFSDTIEKEEFRKAFADLRSLGCTCKKCDMQSCPCGSNGRRCTPLCAGHYDEPRCLKETRSCSCKKTCSTKNCPCLLHDRKCTEHCFGHSKRKQCVE